MSDTRKTEVTAPLSDAAVQGLMQQVRGKKGIDVQMANGTFTQFLPAHPTLQALILPLLAELLEGRARHKEIKDAYVALLKAEQAHYGTTHIQHAGRCGNELNRLLDAASHLLLDAPVDRTGGDRS